MSIEVTLNGLTFDIPTKGEHSWSDLTDWILEVNETISATSDSFIILPQTAKIFDVATTSLYPINTPTTNAHIIFEYGITRYTATPANPGESVTETGTMILAYKSTDGTWYSTVYAANNENPLATLSVSGLNAIQITTTALPAPCTVSQISFRGRIIRT